MEIGVGLPSILKNASAALLLDWARRADEGPFSTLGIIDRLVYHNYESLLTLSAVAGVTRRIRLMTTVLVAPLRNSVLLAKQLATLDALSEGRLTLGLGIGGNQTDYHAADVSFKTRGRQFERQLQVMKRIWAGEPPAENTGPIGPAPAQVGGPKIIIGGASPKALQRIARWGDGFISGGAAGPDRARELYEVVRQAWQEQGREGKPRFVGASYFALGSDARERGGAAIRDYYSFLGPRAENMVSAMPASEAQVTRLMRSFADAGADEVIFWPTIPEMEQLERLSQLV